MTYPTHCDRIVPDVHTGTPTLCGALKRPECMYCDECLDEISRDYSGQVEAEFNDNWSENK